MQLKDLVMNEWFSGIMDDIREEFDFLEGGEAKLKSILDLNVSCLDGDILVFIKRFKHAVDEYQEAEAMDQIQSWFFWKGDI